MLKKLDATGWAIVAVIALAVFLIAGFAQPTFLGFRFDPFGLQARKLAAAEASAAHATLDASARSLEVTGQADQAARVDTYSHLVITTQTAAAQAMAEARSAPDASTPLDPARADRLRLIDSGLCDARSLPGCPAPAEPAGGRDRAM